MNALVKKRIEPENVFKSSGYPYSQAIQSGGGELLFLAGQVALDAESNYIGIGDIAAQTKQVYANLVAVLKTVAADFSNVVDLTTFIVGRQHLPVHQQTIKELYIELLPQGDYPADTVVLVEGLYREEFLIEVKATAVLS